MIRQTIVLMTLIRFITACGTERPDPNDYRTSSASPAPAKSPATGTTPDNTPKTMTGQVPADDKTKANADDPNKTTPTPTPAVKAPIRTVVNAAELAAAQAAYGTDCAGCHMVLATSAKKGRTKAAILAAINITPHTNVKARWPADVADTSDDGIDQASLKLSAMEQALK